MKKIQIPYEGLFSSNCTGIFRKYDRIEFINGDVLCTVRTSLLLGNGPDPPITSVVFDCDNADALPSVIVNNYDRKIIVRQIGKYQH